MSEPWLTYIVGGNTPVGAGKTTLMYHLVSEYMRPPLLDECMDKIYWYIQNLRCKGWQNVTMPDEVQCPVYVVGDSFTSYDSGYDPVTTNELNFEDLRVPSGNKDEDTERILPHSIVCIPDLSTYVDSRDSTKDTGPSELQRKFLALRRKIGVRLIVDGQHYDGADKRWRQMADRVIEIMEFKHTPGDYYNLAKTEWRCRVFHGYKLYENYTTSHDPELYEEITYTHTGDIFGIDLGGEVINVCINSLTGYEVFLGGDNWNFAARPAETQKDDFASVQAKVDKIHQKEQQQKQKDQDKKIEKIVKDYISKELRNKGVA